jgi:hypothetical protein
MTEVFARKLRIEIEEDGVRRPCPMDWMDHFFMRNFTGLSALDETLPVRDGLLEAGLRVSPDEIASQFGNWLRGRKMISPGAKLEVSDIIS